MRRNGWNEAGVDALDKIVPQNAGGVFQHAYKHRDISSVVFDCWSRIAFLFREKLFQLREPSETPITLLSDEAVMSIYRDVRGLY